MDLQLKFLDKSECPSRGKPEYLKQIDITKHNPLLHPLSQALNDYDDYLEPQLNPHQLEILGELLNVLF